MPEIESIARVTITRETSGVTQEGFGTLLIVGPHVSFPERIREFTTPSGYQTLFPAGHPIRLAADAAMTQEPRPERIKIGRQQVDAVTVNVATVLNSTLYTVTIGGLTIAATPVTFTSDASATALEIAAGLVAAINANVTVNPLVNAVDNLNGTFTISNDTAGTPFTVVLDSNLAFGLTYATGRGVSTFTPVATESGANIGAALTAIENEDRDWYGLVIVAIVQADVLAASTFINLRRKVFGTCSDDTNIINQTFAGDTTSIAKQLASAAVARTWLIWNDDPSDFADAAWFGARLPTQPGSETWMFATLAGITFDNLDDTQIANAESKNANTYVRVGGNNFAQQGVTFEPEYIDVIRFIDWLTARMQERLLSNRLNMLKVPITDAGIAVDEASVRAQLGEGITVGGLTDNPAPTVTVPAAADIPAADRAARKMQPPNNIKFTGRLAGALHKTEVSGEITI